MRLAPEGEGAFGRWLVRLAATPSVAATWSDAGGRDPARRGAVERLLTWRCGPGTILVHSFRSREEAQAFAAGVRTAAGAWGPVPLICHFETDWRGEA